VYVCIDTHVYLYIYEWDRNRFSQFARGFLYLFGCKCVYVCIYVYAYIYILTCVLVYICMYVIFVHIWVKPKQPWPLVSLYMYICIYVCVHICIYMGLRVCICIDVHVYLYIYEWERSSFLQVEHGFWYPCGCPCVYMCTYMYVFIWTYMFACVFIYMYICTYISDTKAACSNLHMASGIYVDMYDVYVYVCVYLYIFMYLYVHICMYTHVYLYTYQWKCNIFSQFVRGFWYLCQYTCLCMCVYNLHTYVFTCMHMYIHTRIIVHV